MGRGGDLQLMLRRLRWALGVSAISLTGCAGPAALVSSPSVQVVDAVVLPVPEHALLDSTTGYRIGPFDKIIVDVFGFPDLTRREVQVDASGRFSMPMAGVIEAMGRTPGDVAMQVAQRLRAAHVRDPQVSVNLQETMSQYVTVDGQVVQPGNYPLLGGMTLMRAVAAARGATEFARLDDVVVFRTVNGQKMAALYNLSAIRRGVYGDPMLYSRDIVVVGDSPSRRIFRDVLQAAPLLTTPLVAILQNN